MSLARSNTDKDAEILLSLKSQILTANNSCEWKFKYEQIVDCLIKLEKKYNDLILLEQFIQNQTQANINATSLIEVISKNYNEYLIFCKASFKDVETTARSILDDTVFGEYDTKVENLLNQSQELNDITPILISEYSSAKSTYDILNDLKNEFDFLDSEFNIGNPKDFIKNEFEKIKRLLPHKKIQITIDNSSQQNFVLNREDKITYLSDQKDQINQEEIFSKLNNIFYKFKKIFSDIRQTDIDNIYRVISENYRNIFSAIKLLNERTSEITDHYNDKLSVRAFYVNQANQKNNNYNPYGSGSSALYNTTQATQAEDKRTVYQGQESIHPLGIPNTYTAHN